MWLGDETPIKFKAFDMTIFAALAKAKREEVTSKLSLSISRH